MVAMVDVGDVGDVSEFVIEKVVVLV